MRLGPVVGLLGKILRANLSRSRRIYKLNFAVSYRCNLHCQTCNIWARSPQEELTLEEIDRVFASYPCLSWISLTGGETYLRPDILDIARSAMHRNPNLALLAMNTNGFLTDRILGTMQELVREPRLPSRIMVTVSLDGPRELHDELRGTPGSWERAVATYRGLKSIPHMEVIFGTTLSSLNMGRLGDMVTEVKAVIPEVYPGSFHFNLFNRSSHYYANMESGLCPSLEQMRSLDVWHQGLSQLSPSGILDRVYLSLAREYLSTGQCPIHCQALSSSCFMDPIGDVYPCISFSERLGNVREKGFDLKRILSDPKIEDLRKDIAQLHCPNCWSPCDAYQSIFGDLAGVVRHMLFRARKR